jgi:hypothetical protein
MGNRGAEQGHNAVAHDLIHDHRRGPMLGKLCPSRSSNNRCRVRSSAEVLLPAAARLRVGLYQRFKVDGDQQILGNVVEASPW